MQDQQQREEEADALCDLAEEAHRKNQDDKAEPLLDIALEALNPHPESPRTIFTQLVAAELSLVKDEHGEAAIFADDADGRDWALKIQLGQSGQTV